MLHQEIRFLREFIKHFTEFGSIKNFKYFPDWKKSLTSDFSLVETKTPWINYEAIEFLDRFIGNQSHVFEYGGGASTLYFLSKGARVFTVEHDEKWLDILHNHVHDSSFHGNWTAIRAKPEISTKPVDEALVSDPDMYFSLDKSFAGFTFRDYASRIDEYRDECFDLVVIDGRSRPSCIKHAAKKVSVGGYLIVDNTERAYYVTDLTMPYLDGYKLVLNNFGPSPCSLEFTRTTIWQKMSASNTARCALKK
jgi:hypothetical protein